MEQFGGLIIPLGFLGIFYFLIIRPQQKKEKKVKEMRNSLQVGDDVVTIGGIYGKVTKIKEDMITIEVGADRVKLVVGKWAIGSVITE
ncbi:preprotein translocase, YajC subunit [Alkaliphilus metalliredigens QYMF]|uniref:Preprotein translocase, YajC subunit n=1 Tax=Alkaliphilus metalliredigens (strain QYMF) TaxID=293826 RepID=A6TQM9_ALKMQ|nr:preprotein translocase subunit YajC [Alkaliphilus metalliredigens]ABR48497.1 preprotein translocase, YajC subunit [Alkaliphilus metalliredigens QYMF]